MIGFIPIVFEFVPIAIFLAIFLLMVLMIKYINRLNLLSVGSDICLCALFIQITLLAAPVWMLSQVSINIVGHVAMTFLSFLIWIMTVWLLKRRKPSRTRSTHLIRKMLDYLKKQSSIYESFSYVLGTFTLSVSLMMVLNIVSIQQADFKNQAAFFTLAILSSAAIGYGGYSIYRYLQDEQYSQTFERFLNEITRDNVLMTIQSGSNQIHNRDPIQPVVDIIRGSIMEGIPGPSLFGIKKLKKTCIELLTNSGMQRTNLNKVSMHYIAHIDEIGKLALRMDEDESVMESIESMGEIGVCAISLKLDESIEDTLQRLSEYYEILQSKDFEITKLSVTHSIKRVGLAAANHSIESAPIIASNILDRIGVIEIRKKDSDALQEITTALYEIGKQLAINGQLSSIKHITKKMRNLGISAIQVGMKVEGYHIITYLEEIGTIAASGKLELGVEQVIWSLKDIGLTYAYQQEEEGINMALCALGSIGQESSQYTLNEGVDQALWSLKEVSRSSIADGLETSITQSAQSFAKIAELESDKVEKTMQDLKQYFSLNSSEWFIRFEDVYFTTRKNSEEQ